VEERLLKSLVLCCLDTICDEVGRSIAVKVVESISIDVVRKLAIIIAKIVSRLIEEHFIFWRKKQGKQTKSHVQIMVHVYLIF
jgi:hypothetical protein